MIKNNSTFRISTLYYYRVNIIILLIEINSRRNKIAKSQFANIAMSSIVIKVFLFIFLLFPFSFILFIRIDIPIFLPSNLL